MRAVKYHSSWIMLGEISIAWGNHRKILADFKGKLEAIEISPLE